MTPSQVSRWLDDEEFAARDAAAAAQGYAKLMTVVEQAAETDWRPALEMAKRGHGFSEQARIEHTGTVVHAHVPVYSEDELRQYAGAIAAIPAPEALDNDEDGVVT